MVSNVFMLKKIQERRNLGLAAVQSILISVIAWTSVVLLKQNCCFVY